jgi:hypothetical protein
MLTLSCRAKKLAALATEHHVFVGIAANSTSKNSKTLHQSLLKKQQTVVDTANPGYQLTAKHTTLCHEQSSLKPASGGTAPSQPYS